MSNEIIGSLRQRHVETFMREMREQGIDPTDPFADRALHQKIEIIGAITRAASHAGMLNSIDPDELEPWRAAQLAAAVLGAVWRSFVIPKASSSTPPPTPADSESAPQS